MEFGGYRRYSVSKMNLCDESKTLALNNNNAKSSDERPIEEFQNFNEAELEEADSDENPVNLSDSYDDLPVSDEDDDVQLSSPSNSLNSEINNSVEQRWYAFRGIVDRRWGVNIDDNHNDINNRQLDNRQLDNQPPQQPQEEEETDFLEMDFEPDTNSEIENEATLPLPNLHPTNSNSFNFQLPQPDFRLINPIPNGPVVVASEVESFLVPPAKNTGAKPKQQIIRPQKQTTSRRVTDGDDVFKITISNNNNHINPSQCHPSSIYSSAESRDDIYNQGASSSRSSDRLSFNQDPVGFLKIHKSPAKSLNHHQHTHKQQRLHEEQNDQFLFEIEPLKPRNSVTIYTTNCDEKILIDALVISITVKLTNRNRLTFVFRHR